VTNDASTGPQPIGEIDLETFGGHAYVQRWWSPRAHAELLRFTRVPSIEGAPPDDELISEAELVALVDAAWGEGLLSEFLRRQLFHMVMRRYEEDPSGLWAVGSAELDD